MHSTRTSSESGSPLQSRDGSSATSPTGDDNTTAESIRLAVSQCVAQDQHGIETLRGCVRAARADGVKPEHVVMAIHAAWDKYAAPSGEHDMQRLRLTGVALDAYFGDD